MKRLCMVSVAALTLVAVPALTLAQTRPDFSGTWRFSTERSGRGTEGNSPAITYPSELLVKQTPVEMHLEGRSLRQADMRAVYKFDGSEVTVSTTEGITEKAKAMWDGAKLVITARRSFAGPGGDFETDFRDVWTLNGNVLTIERTVTSDGVSATRRFVFDKATS